MIWTKPTENPKSATTQQRGVAPPLTLGTVVSIRSCCTSCDTRFLHPSNTKNVRYSGSPLIQANPPPTAPKCQWSRPERQPKQRPSVGRCPTQLAHGMTVLHGDALVMQRVPPRWSIDCDRGRQAGRESASQRRRLREKLSQRPLNPKPPPCVFFVFDSVSTQSWTRNSRIRISDIRAPAWSTTKTTMKTTATLKLANLRLALVSWTGSTLWMVHPDRRRRRRNDTNYNDDNSFM